MSAWIVDRAHIDALVLAGVQWRVAELDQLDRWGRELWAANLASVAYRYPNDGDGERPGPCDFRDADAAGYIFRPAEVILDGRRVLWVLASYEYQACEHPGWPQSLASVFCAALRERIEAEGVTRGDDCPDGCWGLSRIEDAAAVVLV